MALLIQRVYGLILLDWYWAHLNHHTMSFESIFPDWISCCNVIIFYSMYYYLTLFYFFSVYIMCVKIMCSCKREKCKWKEMYVSCCYWEELDAWLFILSFGDTFWDSEYVLPVVRHVTSTHICDIHWEWQPWYLRFVDLMTNSSLLMGRFSASYQSRRDGLIRMEIAS